MFSCYIERYFHQLVMKLSVCSSLISKVALSLLTLWELVFERGCKHVWCALRLGLLLFSSLYYKISFLVNYYSQFYFVQSVQKISAQAMFISTYKCKIYVLLLRIVPPTLIFTWFANIILSVNTFQIKILIFQDLTLVLVVRE